MSTWEGFDEDWLAQRRAAKASGDPPLTVGDVRAPERRRGRFRPADLVARSHASEEEAQTAVIDWSKHHKVRERLPDVALLFHVPNGGHRHGVVAAKIKAAGVRRGVPDLLLPVPRPRYGSSGRTGSGALAYWTGFAVELKRGRNDVEKGDAQYQWLRLLQKHGWATDVAHSARQTIALIEEYLTDPTAFVPGR